MFKIGGLEKTTEDELRDFYQVNAAGPAMVTKVKYFIDIDLLFKTEKFNN